MKWIFGSAALVGMLILLYVFDEKPEPDRLGEAIIGSEIFPFPKAQASILLHGLPEVRGLASNRQGDLFLSVANGGVVVSPRGSKMPPREWNVMHSCLNEPCEKVDQRGIAVSENSVYMAEHGRGRLTAADALLCEKDVRTLKGVFEGILGPTGLAVVGNTLFMTDDRPWPGTTADTSYDSADYNRWLDKGTPRLFGTLSVCTLDAEEEQCVPKVVGSRLPHPSGIAAVCPGGPVFVTESDAAEVRWPIFNWNSLDAKWNQTGALGSVATSGKVLPPFLGIALDEEPDAQDHPAGHYVFAAGPDGLYVFDRKGGSLGRVIFEEQVTGVAYSHDNVYLIVGHMLCRLTIDPKVKKLLPQGSADNCSSSPYLAPVSPNSNDSQSPGNAANPGLTK
jgi:hypothetical protein